ncbi:MAG: hypothetical protein LBS19_15225, partial [Clostridiales bacterium]|nr:hypothetical protein [Clostridiales bacterium]
FFKETPIKSAALRLTNTVEKPEAKDQKERRYSSSELVMTMRPKIMNKDIIIRLDLFQGGGFTHFEGSIPEGMSLPDGLSVLSEFLGVPTDFAEYIPEGMEFLDAAKLFSLSFAIDNNKEAQTLSLPKLREMSFEIGINGNLFSVFEPYLQFRDPRLMISYLNGEKGWSDGLVSGYIGGQFVIGNKKLNKDLLVLDTVASYPVFDFEISQEGSLSAKDLAECFGWKLPTVIEEAKIEGISAYISPSEKSFQAGFQVTDAFNFSDVLKLENISLDFSYGNELFGLDLAALLNIESGGKNLLSLSAEASIESSGYISVHASFYNRESSLYGFDEPNISISEIYKALFKSELPAGFPAIEIRRFELDFSTGQNSMLTANSYGLSLDASVLLDTVAKGLKAETKIKISNNEIDLNGAFLLNISSGLNLEFGLSYKSQSGKPGNVGFHFMFDRIKVNLLYDANAKKLSGNVNLSSYTLGEAASFITKLFNPEFSLGHSDEWGFLYNMKLPDTSFSYDMENKSLTVMFTVAKSLPFLTLEKAGIKLDKNGVRFVVVGKFLDTAYTEKTPLTWDTSSSPPPTAGKLLDVSYLALANNVEVQTKGQYFIDRLKSLKEQLPVNYEPSELTLSPKAGYLFALDSRIMDTLDIRLMYYEGGPVLGAGFKLSGPKAAPLSGLEADILYAKVNETVGLFSGRVIPPDILRNIVLGTISVGIGDVAVQIYTNGDFYIDLGFPHNSDFSRSFFLQYTVFVGRGGIWVRRDTLGNTPGLPARSDGYYSPVLGCGIGLQIGLERGFSVSMLSAKLSLTLAGIFEGTFATFLKYNGGSDLYYKVRAYCALSGNLSGSINFGPVGAGVSIGIHTGMNLVIESNMPTIIDLFLQVYAQASVRIGWFNVYFSCNLSFSQQFRLGQKDIFGALPHYPDMLEFPSVNDNTPYPVKLFVLPVLSSLHGENVAVFLPAMSREDFAAIVNKLAGLAIYNNCLEDIGGFGIFIERPLFRNDFDLERFLADNFLFTLDFNQLNQGEDNGDETQVFMPMPPFVTIQCLNISRNLEKEHPVDEGYLEAMRKYYMAMEDRDDYSGIRYDYSENKTLSYHIFSEYFEIILRMLRSEKAKSLRENRVFDGLRLTDDQLDNIIGGTMRFLFGGKRVPDTDNMKTRLGFFNAAGQQFSLSSMDSDNHMGVIRLSEGVPCWLKLSGGLDSVSTDLLKLEPYLPPVNPPPADQIFLTKPYMTTPYTVNGFTEVLLSKTVLFKDKFTALPLSERGTGRLAEIPKNGIGFGSIIRFGAERSFIASDGDIAVYELNAYDNTDELESLLSKGCGTLEAELFYLSDGGSGEYHSCKTYPVIAVTEGISQDEHMYADLLDQPIRFLELLRLSYKLDGSFSLIMPPGSGVGEAEAQNFALLVKEKEELGIRKEWHNCYLAVPETPELTLKYESEESYPSVYQGFAVINAAIAKPGANAGRHDYLDSYRSLMAVLTDKGVPVSTETMPVFEVSETREDADKAHISLSIPYYRFIGDGGDVYAGIGGAAETEANLYLVDLLGNESEPVAKCTGRACYTDFLVPIGDYPGLNVSFCLETSGGGDMLTVLFRYRKAEHEDEYTKMSFAECILQFAQPDAALRLYSPLLSADKEGVLLDKQGLLEFLYACAKQTEPEELFFTQKAPLSPLASGIVSCEARLVMSRNRELCHKEAPADVYHAVSSIDY